MFDTICRMIPADPDYSPRTRHLDILGRVLAGTFYDVLPYAFHEERDGTGQYVPLRHRRPSVRYPLARIVVDDTLALVFSDGHFPTLDSPDAHVRHSLATLADATNLNAVMLDAALRGSVGSVAVLLRVLQGRVFLDVLDSLFLSPVWDPAAPDTLLSVTERYKVEGSVLAAQGYDITDPRGQYWFMRRWDARSETWFLPQSVSQSSPPEPDPARSVVHDLGFVPIVWVRNLPGGNGIDGGCTFRPAIETTIEIDYQLSQAGRGLKYSSDPTLLIREPAGLEGDLLRGGGNALVVSEKGDARLLEINGSAAAAVIDYVRTLRAMALESVHGNRANPDRLQAGASGRAIDLLNQGLLFLADNLRVSYGSAIVQLARMMLRAAHRYPLLVGGHRLGALDSNAPLHLVWPDWHPPSADDQSKQANAVIALRQAGLLSTETALKNLANSFNLSDVMAEIGRIQDTAPQ